MAKPGALALGVLPRFEDDPLERGVAIDLTPYVLPNNVVSRGVPRRRFSRNRIGQSTHFIRPPALEHGRGSSGDPGREVRTRIDQKIEIGRASCRERV